jgi:DNA mismatch repair protein MutS2
MMESQSKKDLEFAVVLEQFASNSLSEEGKAELRSMPFCTEKKPLEERQEAISGFLRLLSSGMVRRPDSFPDLTDFFAHVGDLRYAPNGPTIYQVALWVRSAGSFCTFCHATLDDKLQDDTIKNLLGDSIDSALVSLSREIFSTLESDGSVKETHPAIAALLRRVEAAKQGRQKFIRDYINAHTNQVQSDQGALRDGRMVIPMRTDRTIKDDGFVTGTSQSGSTLFVEPFHLVEMNNEVSIAQEQILIEIAKILRQLSDSVRRCKSQLLSLRTLVSHADALYALAVSCHLLPMTRSDLDGVSCKMVEARHPLLGKKAVPITMVLDPKVKAVVLTGPNAGGKTVTIKTVGLVAMINQLCGYIPCKEGSSLPLFDAFYTEIGDDQSIEEGLSTFSSHMRRIAEILSSMTTDSLVILDELGSGTDPVEGSALARAILESCIKKAGLTLVTSHHGVLKEFAYAREDVMNASMAFDDDSHSPTFRVIQGIPGDSHALDTAMAMHVDKEVIDRARSYLGSSAVQIGEVIKGLEKKRQELLENERQMKEKQAELQARLDDVAKRELLLREGKMKLLDEQDTELARFMRQKNSELETLVADLKSGEVTKEKTQKVKQYIASLQAKKNEAETVLANEEKRLSSQMPKTTFEEGEAVLCGKSRREGVIIRNLKNGSYQVAIGPMKMTLKAKELQRPKREESPSYQVSYAGATPDPVMVLDVRGLTLEEALHKLDLQIESALVHGLSTFSVIHGYGDGILSKGIGEYLKHHPSVKDYRFAMPEDGGMGKTYVML